MKLMVYLKGSEDGRSYTVDFEKYKEENKNVLTKAFTEGDVPEEIRLINRIPEIDFMDELVFGREENTREPLKCLYLDCGQKDSALCRFMAGSATEIGPEKQAEIFLAVMESFLKDRLENVFGRGQKNVGYYDVFYGYPKVDKLDVFGGCNRPTFRIELPKELVEKYYGESGEPGMEEFGVPRFFDLNRLSREEMTAYVIPRYYMELGMWDRKALRENKQKMAELRDCWMGTLFAALA